MTQAILVMAYGTPANLDDVAAYYTHIRHGRPPGPHELSDLVARYEAIGGRSPLPEITKRQAEGITERTGIPTFVGYKHTAPFIRDAIDDMKQRGVREALGLVMAPHYSSMSVGDYERRANQALSESGWPAVLRMIHSWHLEPAYIDLLATYCREAARALDEGATFIFTAHSLPKAIERSGDPYPDQLRQTAAAVAARAGIDRWRVGWQSAGRTNQPWLGPDVLEILDELAEHGAPAVVVCPCGFVADHLEVLHDLDIEAASRAKELGIRFVRTQSPNDDPPFLDMLSSLVTRALENA